MGRSTWTGKKVAAAAVVTLFVGMCMARSDKTSRTQGASPGTPEDNAQSSTECDLNCRIQKATTSAENACASAEFFQRDAQDKAYDLDRGVRSGTLSASDVREAADSLGVSRATAAHEIAACKEAQAELKKLNEEATRAARAAEKKTTAAAKTPAKAKPKPKALAKNPTPQRLELPCRPGQAPPCYQ